MRDTVRSVIGEDTANKLRTCWNVDLQGEIQTCWRNSFVLSVHPSFTADCAVVVSRASGCSAETSSKLVASLDYWLCKFIRSNSACDLRMLLTLSTFSFACPERF